LVKYFSTKGKIPRGRGSGKTSAVPLRVGSPPKKKPIRNSSPHFRLDASGGALSSMFEIKKFQGGSF